MKKFLLIPILLFCLLIPTIAEEYYYEKYYFAGVDTITLLVSFPEDKEWEIESLNTSITYQYYSANLHVGEASFIFFFYNKNYLDLFINEFKNIFNNYSNDERMDKLTDLALDFITLPNCKSSGKSYSKEGMCGHIY